MEEVVWIREYDKENEPVLDSAHFDDLSIGDNFLRIAFDSRIYRKTGKDTYSVVIYCKDVEEAIRCL